MTDDGVIYCPPSNQFYGILLKIDTNTDDVTELDPDLLPPQKDVDDDDMWMSCAVALDGCIYFMPLQCPSYHEVRSKQ